MCNRYRPTRRDKMELAEQYREHGLDITWNDIDEDGTVYKGGDVYPLYQAPIVRQIDDSQLLVEYRTWGLLPPNFRPKTVDVEKERKAQQRKLVNARSEGLANTWPWKLVYRNQRCVLPAENFYEPHRDGGQARYEVQGECIFIAGLWSDWESRALETTFRTFTMLTTDACSVVKDTRGGQRRDRQPVVFTNLGDVAEYLNLETVEYDQLSPLFASTAADGLTCEHVPK